MTEASPALDPIQLVLPSLLAMQQDVARLLSPTPHANPAQAAYMLEQMARGLHTVGELPLAHFTSTLATHAPLFNDAELAAQAQSLLQVGTEQLGAQLQHLNAGQASSANTLFETYRELVKLQGKDSAHPADLWHMQGHIPSAPLNTLPATIPLVPGDAVRNMLDQHVLTLIKSGDTHSAHALHDLSLGLAQTAPSHTLRTTWQLSAGWLNALAHNCLPIDLYTKRLASRLRTLYTAQARGDLTPPETLQRELLYYCHQAHHATQAAPPTLRAMAVHCGLYSPAAPEPAQPAPEPEPAADTTATAPHNAAPHSAPPLAPAETPSPDNPFALDFPDLLDTAHVPEVQPTATLLPGPAAQPHIEPNAAFLQHVDELSAQLDAQLQQWQSNTHTDAQPASAHRLAEALTRQAWNAGSTDLATLAHQLEKLLARLTPDASRTQRSICAQTAQEVRRLLHQFAAGFIRRPHPKVLQALQQLLADLPEAPPHSPAAAAHEQTTESSSPDTPAEEAAAAPDAAANAAPAARQQPTTVLPTWPDPQRFALLREEVHSVWPALQRSLDEWCQAPQALRESGPPRELLRLLHTLKGSARMAGANVWASQVHALEEAALDSATTAPSLISPLQALRLAFTALEQAMALRHPETSQHPSQHKPLDAVARHAQALWSTHNHARQGLQACEAGLHEMASSLQQLREHLADCAAWADTLMLYGDLDLSYEWHAELGDMLRALRSATDDLGTIQQTAQHSVRHSQKSISNQSGHLHALQHTLLYARMVPLRHIATRLQDTVRLAALDNSKAVDFSLQGEELLLERSTLDALTPALEHLLRNCVYHGIEGPATRRHAGKDSSGRIHVQLEQEGPHYRLRIQDDGMGLDVARIHAKAVALGLVDAGTPATAAQAAELIMHPGLSTADAITERAGRGIGMDAVQHQIQAAGGQLHIDTISGQGCTFTITLPAPPQVEQIVALRAGNWRVAVPARHVQALHHIPWEQAHAALAQGLLRSEATGPVPLFWGGALWQQSARSTEMPLSGQATIVLLHSHTQRWAVMVDEVLDTQEVVLQADASTVVRLPGLLGTAAQPSGEVLPVYDPAAVIADHESRLRNAASQPHSAPADTEEAEAPLVMLADDSLSVRRLAQHLLQSNGLRVATAADGLQALALLEDGLLPDLLLVDIEMPGINGMELVRRLRADARWQQLPIVVLTAHEAGPVSQQALALGAQAYLTKPYSPDGLLAQVRRYTRHAPAASAPDTAASPTAEVAA